MRIFAQEKTVSAGAAMAPAFDYEAGMDGADPEVLLVLGATTAPLVQASHTDLTGAFAEGDVALVAHFAHALKGMVAYFGARPVYAHAAAIEHAARSGKLDAAAAFLPLLDAEISQFLPVLNRRMFGG